MGEDVPEVLLSQEAFQGRIDARGQVLDVGDGLGIELEARQGLGLFEGRLPGSAPGARALSACRRGAGS